MREKDFLHVQLDDNMLTIHDCEANSIYIEDDTLVFRFNDGFWIGSDHPDNPYDKCLRTDASELRLKLNDSPEHVFSFFAHTPLFRRPRITLLRREYSLSELICMLGSRGYELTFINKYDSSDSYFFTGYISRRRHYCFKQFNMTIDASQISFHWNNLRPDCPW